MKRKTLVGVLAVLLVPLAVWAVISVERGTQDILHTISQAGDVAQVTKVNAFSARDSFDYIDTIIIRAAGPIPLKWTSPVQKMALSLDVDSAIDSANYYDTVIFPGATRLGVNWLSPVKVITVTPTTALDLNTYACTLQFAADTLGIEWVAPSSGTTIAMVADSVLKKINDLADLTDTVTATDGTTDYVVTSNFSGYNLASTWTIATDTACDTVTTAETTLAMWADTITALIEAKADLTDSVTAHDSVSYVLLFSNFSQDNNGGRWTVKQTGTADNNGQDTATGGRIATVQMVIDSMVALINVTATILDTVVAADSGGTAYNVTSLNPGVAFVVAIGDTAQDTVHITANATSFSSKTDTIPLFGMYQNGWDALWGKVTLTPATVNKRGYGADDSGWIWLYATVGDDWQLVDSAVGEGLPVTMDVAQLANDTLWREHLKLVTTVSDSATDSVYIPKHRVVWEFIGN